MRATWTWLWLLIGLLLAAAPAGCERAPARPGLGAITPAGDGFVIRGPGRDFTEPDLAAVGADRLYVAWLAHDGRHDTILAATRSPAGWSAPVEVSAGPGGYLAPRLAADGRGGAWVVWPAQRDGQYDLLARHLQGTSGGPIERITSHPGPDTEPAVVVDRDGVLWVTWESFRDGSFDLFARRRTAAAWGEELRITDHPASDVQPTLALDDAGTPWLAWMSWRDGRLEDGNYEIYARALADPEAAPVRVSTSPRVDMFPSLVSTPGGLALVWTEACFRPRTIETLTVPSYDRWDDKVYQVSWLRGGQWSAPCTVRLTPDDRQEGAIVDQATAVAGPAADEVWILYEHARRAGPFDFRWSAHLCRVRPGRIAAPVDISGGADTAGRHVGAGWLGGTLWLAHGTETLGGSADGAGLPAIRVRPLDPGAFRDAAPLPVWTAPPRPEPLRPVSPALPGRAERHTVEHGGRTWRAYFGNLHCHSDCSRDGRPTDGPPVQNFRAVYDVAELDFAALTDHSDGLSRGDWWTLRKLTDLWNRPGDFVTFPGYEWTSMRFGHRNVIFADTRDGDAASLFRAFGGQTPADLWSHLGRRRALTIPHHPAHNILRPLDWSFRDDRFQRLVEIFQRRGNYEYDGAPLQDADDVKFEFSPGHCVRDALALGHRLGIIASPDHAGGLGLAGVWAEALDRPAIFEALASRRCFGTTGAKLALYFEANGAPQGSELTGGDGPVTLRAHVHGTAPGLTLTIVRDGEEVHRTHTDAAEAVLEWTDPAPVVRTRYYYLRAEQPDSHIGWTSPVWITPAPP